MYDTGKGVDIGMCLPDPVETFDMFAMLGHQCFCFRFWRSRISQLIFNCRCSATPAKNRAAPILDRLAGKRSGTAGKKINGAGFLARKLRIYSDIVFRRSVLD